CHSCWRWALPVASSGWSWLRAAPTFAWQKPAFWRRSGPGAFRRAWCANRAAATGTANGSGPPRANPTGREGDAAEGTELQSRPVQPRKHLKPSNPPANCPHVRDFANPLSFQATSGKNGKKGGGTGTLLALTSAAPAKDDPERQVKR